MVEKGLKVSKKNIVNEKNYWKISGSHDGYLQRFGTIHEREIEFYPEQMKFIANEVQNGRFLLCPNGSHLSQFDDQGIYFEGLIKFIKDVDNGAF